MVRMDKKYYYFEMHIVHPNTNRERVYFDYDNWLLNQPHTSSSGYWGSRSLHTRKNITEKVVDQFWIDYTKLDFEKFYELFNKSPHFVELTNHVEKKSKEYEEGRETQR